MRPTQPHSGPRHEHAGQANTHCSAAFQARDDVPLRSTAGMMPTSLNFRAVVPMVGVMNAIAQARHKTPDEVKTLIDNAPYGAAKAKEAGLVDDVLYRDDVEKQFKKLLGYKDTDQLVAVRREVLLEQLAEIFFR